MTPINLHHYAQEAYETRLETERAAKIARERELLEQQRVEEESIVSRVNQVANESLTQILDAASKSVYAKVSLMKLSSSEEPLYKKHHDAILRAVHEIFGADSHVHLTQDNNVMLSWDGSRDKDWEPNYNQEQDYRDWSHLNPCGEKNGPCCCYYCEGF